MIRSFEHWKSAAAARVVLALVAVLLSCASARAACGDYLQVGGHGGGPERAERPLQPGPCHGPNCSQAPGELPLVPAAPVVQDTRSAALEAVAPVLLPGAPVRFALPASARVPASPNADSIYHPPR